MKIVIMRDIKADAYGMPIFVASLGAAVRSFGDEINKTDGNPLALHPEDYELYDFGEFDELLGKFSFHDQPKQLAVGSNYRK